MWVYRRSESQLWTVGYYDDNGSWNPDSDHDSPQKAADRCAYLNGKRREPEKLTAATNVPSFVYLVTGDNGKEYEDHVEWTVCAYRTLEGAKAHARLATDNRIRAECGENPYDDNLYGTGCDTTSYGVVKLRLLTCALDYLVKPKRRKC